MKKIYLLIAALAFGTALNAADTPKSSFSVTADFPYTTNYVFRGQELAKDSVQPSVQVSYTDFYAGIWMNQPLKSGVDNEIDYNFGYKYSMNDQWNIDSGLSIYTYPQTVSTPGFHRATYEGYMGFVGTIKGITTGVYAYYDFTLKNTTMQAQVGYSIPLQKAGVSLDFAANVGRVFADLGDCYNYVGVGLNIPYQISEKATIYAGATYNNHDVKGLVRDIVAFKMGLTLAF